MAKLPAPPMSCVLGMSDVCTTTVCHKAHCIRRTVCLSGYVSACMHGQQHILQLSGQTRAVDLAITTPAFNCSQFVIVCGIHARFAQYGCASRQHAHRSVEVLVGDTWVLPCLWQEAVVPVDIVGVEAELALLHVLLDGVGGLILYRTCTSTPFCQTL